MRTTRAAFLIEKLTTHPQANEQSAGPCCQIMLLVDYGSGGGTYPPSEGEASRGGGNRKLITELRKIDCISGKSGCVVDCAERARSVDLCTACCARYLAIAREMLNLPHPPRPAAGALRSFETRY